MASLRAFLKLQPQPSLLVCEYDDDDREPRKVKLGEARSRFRDAEMACKGAVRIEALDADGNTLRLWEAEDAPMRDAAQAVKPPTTSAATPVSNTEQMLTTIARLLVEAGDSAAARQSEVMVAAMSAQTELVTMMSQRLSQFETVWQQMLMQRAEELDAEREELDNATPPPEQTDPNADMIKTLLTGAVMSQMQGPANGKTGS